MRIIAQGTTTIGAGATTRLIPEVSLPAATNIAWVWVGAGDSNSATVRVGIKTNPQHYLAATDLKGFAVEHDAPGDIVVTGTAGNIVRWAAYADE